MSYAGLGTCWKVDDSGAAVDCDSWGNLFNGICWTPGTCQSAQPQPLPPGSSGGSGGGVQLPPCGTLDYFFATPGVNCQAAAGSVITTFMWVGVAILGGLIVLEVMKR